MKVAVVDPSGFTLPYDGHLCSALEDAGCDVRLYTAEADRTQTFEQVPLFHRLTGSLLSHTDTFPRTVLKGAEYAVDSVSFVREIRAWDPDVVHYQWLPLPVVDYPTLAALSTVAPLVLTVHDSDPFHGSETSRLQLVGMRPAMRLFDVRIVHTEYTRAKLIESGFNPDSISVVPHGVLDYPTEEVHSEENRILFFGNIKKYKGLETAIRALGELRERTLAETTLVVAGKPHVDVDRLKSLAGRLGVGDSIEWRLGYVPEDKLPSLFGTAELVVLPYRQIDQSGVLLTAVGYGTPVVATDVGGFGEVVEDGTHGRLVAPEDPSAFAAAVEDLLTDDDAREAMSAAMDRLADELSWTAIAEQTTEVYRRAGER